MAQTYDTILTEVTQKRKPSFAFSKTYPAYLVLILGLLASIGIWYLMKERVETERKLAFDKSVASVMTRMNNGYRDHEQVLRSIDGLYDGYIQVVRDVFELYASIPTKTYSSILSADYVPYVANSRKGEFIFYAQSERYLDYSIFPAGTRNEYYPIEYVVPYEKNSHRNGYDLATDPVLNETIQYAKKHAGYTATPFLHIRPDTVGFMLMTRVFKRSEYGGQTQNFDGVVLLEVEADRFFKNSLGNSTASDTAIAFQCFAPFGRDEKKEVVYTSSNFKTLASMSPEFEEDRTFRIADKAITVNFRSLPNVGGGFQKLMPLISLIGSIITSFVLFGFVLSMTTSRIRALDLADRMTRSQRRIVDSSKDIIAVMDNDGVWKTMNPASIGLLGYTPEEIIGRPITEFFKNQEDIREFNDVLRTAEDEVATHMDIETRTNAGDVRWISWNFTVSHKDGVVYCVGRDVTQQKIAEEQVKLKSRQVELAENFALEASEFKSGFMIEIGHKLRNSLTGIIGYLQLLSEQMKESKEEEQTYISMAEQSSEELYSVVIDMLDKAESEINQSEVQLKEIRFSELIKQLQNELKTGENIIDIKTSGDDVHLKIDRELLQSALLQLLEALHFGLQRSTTEIVVQMNSYEKNAEIQILAPANPYVGQMIANLKKDKEGLLEALEQDEHSILFRLALAASIIRRMSGTAAFEGLDEDGNVIMITLPGKLMEMQEVLKV
jgi:PAS domain S-box-containing protein